METYDFPGRYGFGIRSKRFVFSLLCMIVRCQADEGDLTWSHFLCLARPAQMHGMADGAHNVLSGPRIAIGGLASLQSRSASSGPPDLRPASMHDRSPTGLVRFRQHRRLRLPVMSQHDNHSTVHPGTQPQPTCPARPRAAEAGSDLRIAEMSPAQPSPGGSCPWAPGP
jgi:hypothetical protein